MRPVRAEVRGVGLLPFLRFRALLAFACVRWPEVVPLAVVPHGSDLYQMVQLICFFLHIPLNLFEIESKKNTNESHFGSSTSLLAEKFSSF